MITSLQTDLFDYRGNKHLRRTGIGFFRPFGREGASPSHSPRDW